MTLKPCPFCGDHAESVSGGDGDGRRYGTRCSDWKCPGHNSILIHVTRDAADQAWNLRASSPIPAIDYDALISAAALINKRWKPGTTGCVAFSRGAQWFHLQALNATSPTTEPATTRAEGALKSLVIAMERSVDEAPLNEVLSLATGLFVNLVTELCKYKGHDESLPITVDGGTNRNITIHPPKG
jgi:hypothetical protein